MKNEKMVYITTTLLSGIKSYSTGFESYFSSNRHAVELLAQIKKLSLNLKEDDGFIVDFHNQDDDIVYSILISEENHENLTGEIFTIDRCEDCVSQYVLNK